jgi:ribosomal protein S16
MPMQDNARFALGLLAMALMLAGAGCSGKRDLPELASVSGKVTLDGKPLARARVYFIPENGRPSSAETDADGFYQLRYSEGASGAMLGKHIVRVSTYRPADEEKNIAAGEETVPAKYNTGSTLTREVRAGKNEINLELQLDGPIVQPSQ